MRSLLGTLTRTTPVNDAPDYVSRGQRWAVAGGSMLAGQTLESQMRAQGSVGTLFAITERLSTAVARLEWHLYRKAKSGKKEDRVEVTSHAALDVWNKPNKFYTRNEFAETFQQHLDLTGEAWWLASRHTLYRNAGPLELWPIRPDRILPCPAGKKFLSGYDYIAPDGQHIPLDLDEVIGLRMPNPLDPFRGLGPVQSLLVNLDSARYTAEWNRNFFRNSAEPGGIIEVEKRLSDPEFDEMNERWNEQHRGVANAHRVAIIEQGKWVTRTFSMRDMQFAELREVSRDVILEGFGFPKNMLGITQDVNRATAEAGEYVFSKWLVVTRADRIKGALNNDFLPLFGDTARDLEFDYESPVQEDIEAINAERTSKATAAKTYIDAGFTGESVVVALDLPDTLEWEKPAPKPVPVPPQLPAPAEEPAPAPVPAPEDNLSTGQLLANLLTATRPATAVRNANLPEPPEGTPEYDIETVDGIDLSPVQAAWDAALAALLAAWTSSVVAAWIDQLTAAIRQALADNDRAGLAALAVDTDAAAEQLADAMAGLAETAAGHAVDEAAGQDTDLSPKWPDAGDLRAAAAEVAAFEGQRYALTAGREAARLAGPDADPDEVADQVRTHLDEMSTAGAETALGGALTDAQNQARQATFLAGPVGALYASEQMDRNTCAPCREVHGRWICNTDDLGALYALYPTGGYIDCLGRWRCRGTWVGVWRPQTTKGGQ